MKRLLPVMVLGLAVGLASAGVARAQSSLFNRYDVNMRDWAKLPPDVPWGGETSMVAVSNEGRVMVITRVPPYFRELTREGEFVRAWGDDESLFTMAHSVHFDSGGNVWAADAQRHVVHKFSPDGELLMTLGEAGMAGDNTSENLFNQPNYVAFGPSGDVFVSDGYRNSRIVQFTEDGEFVRIIGGEMGSAPGQLDLPHGVAIDSAGRIFVSDSNNARISVFSPEGEFLEIWNAPSRGGIQITPDDTVYVSDVNAGAVTILRDGVIQDVIHVEGRPHGLGVDPATGDVYTSSSIRTDPVITKSTPKPAEGSGN